MAKQGETVICADVGGSFIDLALVSGVVLSCRARIPTPLESWDAFAGVFQHYLLEHAAELPDHAAVSIALAGLHDQRSGKVISANIPAIHNRIFARDLAMALQRRIIITNDADCFALAEAGVGLARGQSRVLGIVLGTGVGGGLVMDGRLVTSQSGVGGEWGHGPIVGLGIGGGADIPDFPCGCGQTGCLDTVGGARGLERLHRFLGGEPASSHQITDSWLAGEADATRTIALFVEILSGPLAMLLNLMPMNIVPVGGGLANCPPLIAELDKAVRRRMLVAPDQPLLRPSELDGDAGLLGAALASALHDL